ncbi:hypothetical protein [Serratia quinivorans]|uniref:hypothetical protein n=1 Tax=Serratia quinivorans TaxID=137545 RepID=UPI00217AA365|nr:hypothetical protein [Serratia quinivorans]CAI0896124.1 Uncharacterised protein [Serratia quinivorans]CAI2019000.1 Uncharacterised protein [Serratia quinivorans]
MKVVINGSTGLPLITDVGGDLINRSALCRKLGICPSVFCRLEAANGFEGAVKAALLSKRRRQVQ